MSANKLVGVIGLIILCVLAYTAFTGQPRLQDGGANGAYVNSCCGTVVFSNGIMTVENQRIGYVIEQDNAGPYVLPSVYVGASSKGFVIKPYAIALKLRLDDTNQPHQIELLDDSPNGAVFSFMRTSGR